MKALEDLLNQLHRHTHMCARKAYTHKCTHAQMLLQLTLQACLQTNRTKSTSTNSTTQEAFVPVAPYCQRKWCKSGASLGHTPCQPQAHTQTSAVVQSARQVLVQTLIQSKNNHCDTNQTQMINSCNQMIHTIFNHHEKAKNDLDLGSCHAQLLNVL